MKSISDHLQKPSRESMPWALWHWNLSLTKSTILEQFSWFEHSKFGGIIIRPSRDMEPAYLSDEFFQLFKIVLENAQNKNIAIRLADDFSLPWSGLLKNEMSCNPKIRSRHLRLVENRLTYDQQEITILSVDANNTFAVAIKESNGVPDPSTAAEIEIKGDNLPFKWQPPEGTWRIFVFRKEYTENPSGGYTPNVFSNTSSELYIQQILEQFRERFSGHVPATFEGFINELPPLFSMKYIIPWDDDFIVRFRNKFKKNILKLLPALFYDSFPGAQKSRQQIYTFLYESVYERFVLPLEEWAGKNRMSQWVLVHERSNSKSSDGLITGFVPQISGLQASGFQNVDGVQESHVLLRIMADVNTTRSRRTTITVLGRNRTGTGSTLQSLKSDADRMLLAGTSRIVIDGFFSNLDQRSYCKTPVTPAWYAPDGHLIKDLCVYIARISELLKNVHWNRQVAVLSPVSEIMAAYVPGTDCASPVAFDRCKKTIHALERNGLSYDLVTEQFLSECSIRNNGEFGTADRVRKGNYQALIVPYAPDISRSVLIFIEKLVQKEGCVLFAEEVPHGTIEDGVSSATTTRFDKIIAQRHKSTGILSLDTPDETLGVIDPCITMLQNSKYSSEIATACGQKDGDDIYLFHNNSDVKDQISTIEIPNRTNFFIVDCEHADIQNVAPQEKIKDTARFNLSLPPKATILLIGSSAAATHGIHDHKARASCNPFTIPERSYRILLKDQWTFTTLSMNAFPLPTWNVRIGLSRESGGFSHFYESHFQTKNIPSSCQLIVNSAGLAPGYAPFSACDLPVEITINGTKVDRAMQLTTDSAGNPEPMPSILSALNTTSLVYSIKEHLLRGANRISLRTTGLVCASGTLCYPPVLFGNFLVIKGQNGGCIDKLVEVPMQNSWVKNGFPYLYGTGIYHQSFELPDGYKKLVLSFPNVSGAIDVTINGKNLGSFKWQPMCIDITQACEQKRNELTVSVTNSIDTLLRMNGRPSGITGDVYLDVY